MGFWREVESPEPENVQLLLIGLVVLSDKLLHHRSMNPPYAVPHEDELHDKL